MHAAFGATRCHVGAYLQAPAGGSLHQCNCGSLFVDAAGCSGHHCNYHLVLALYDLGAVSVQQHIVLELHHMHQTKHRHHQTRTRHPGVVVVRCVMLHRFCTLDQGHGSMHGMECIVRCCCWVHAVQLIQRSEILGQRLAEPLVPRIFDLVGVQSS